MTGTICGGFLFLGGVLALGFSTLSSDAVLLMVMGFLCAIAGGAILLSELFSYYMAKNRKTLLKGDAEDDT